MPPLPKETLRPALYVDSRGLKRQAFSRTRGAGEAVPGIRPPSLRVRSSPRHLPPARVPKAGQYPVAAPP